MTCPPLIQVTALMPYLMSHRSRVLSGAEGVGESVNNGPAAGSVDGGAAGARLSRQELLRIIDTAIVKVHMLYLRTTWGSNVLLTQPRCLLLAGNW